MKSNKVLALALLLGLSASSAQAVSCECLKSAASWYKGQWSSLVYGVKNEGKDAGIIARLEASYKGVLPTAVVVSALGFLAYKQVKAYQAKRAAQKAA